MWVGLGWVGAVVRLNMIHGTRESHKVRCGVVRCGLDACYGEHEPRHGTRESYKVQCSAVRCGVVPCGLGWVGAQVWCGST